MSSIIGAVAALLLVASSACIIVHSVRGAAVVPASAPDLSSTRPNPCRPAPPTKKNSGNTFFREGPMVAGAYRPSPSRLDYRWQ